MKKMNNSMIWTKKAKMTIIVSVHRIR